MHSTFLVTLLNLLVLSAAGPVAAPNPVSYDDGSYKPWLYPGDDGSYKPWLYPGYEGTATGSVSSSSTAGTSVIYSNGGRALPEEVGYAFIGVGLGVFVIATFF